MDYYYLNEEKKAVGPVSALAMAALRQTGVVKSDTLVALDGDEQWRPAAIVLPPLMPPQPARSKRSSSAVPFSGGGRSIVGVTLGIILLAGVGLAWGLLKKNSLPDKKPVAKAAPIQDEPISPADSGKVPVVEPVLGGIEPAPLPPPLQPVPPPQVAAAPVEPVVIPAAPPAKMPEGPAKETPPVSPPPPVVAEEHVLGEWYELGYEQGAEIGRAFDDLGNERIANRAHLFQMIRHLDVDPDGIAASDMRICFEGYEDGVAGEGKKYKPLASQAATELPEKLRIYTKLPAPAPAPPAFKVALAEALAATVKIRTDKAQGSGFYIFPGGVIATNRHVLKGANTVYVQDSQGRSFPARFLGKSEQYDFALIQIDLEDHPIIKIAPSNEVEVGDEVTAIGFPGSNDVPGSREYSATTTFGRISSIDRVQDGNPCFQIDLSINHGNSGGPVIDSNGKVIGVATFGFSHVGVDRFNFAIKMEALIPFIRSIINQ